MFLTILGNISSACVAIRSLATPQMDELTWIMDPAPSWVGTGKIFQIPVPERYQNFEYHVRYQHAQ